MSPSNNKNLRGIVDSHGPAACDMSPRVRHRRRRARGYQAESNRVDSNPVAMLRLHTAFGGLKQEAGHGGAGEAFAASRMSK